MANLQVRNVPHEFHERLRRLAQKENSTMSAFVLAAVEKELARLEWQERMAQRTPIDLGVDAATLIAETRAERDAELNHRWEERREAERRYEARLRREAEQRGETEQRTEGR